MNTKRALAASFLVLLSACSAECSCGGSDTGDDDDTTSGQGGSGITVTVGSGGAGGAGTTAGSGGSGGEGGSGPTGDALIRLAHFSPDSAGVNVCLVNEEGEALGPVIDGGLEFTQTTEYAGIDAGTYQVLLTAAGADDCGTPLATFEEAIVIAEGDVVTAAVTGLAAGEGDEALSLFPLVDDVAPPDAGFVKARFVHSAVGAPPVDVGYLDAEDVFVPIWEGATYPSDAGYVQIEAFDTLELVAVLAGTDTPTGIEVQVNGTDGAIVEGFALGSIATGFQVLVVETLPE